jgi:hypothetical protein
MGREEMYSRCAGRRVRGMRMMCLFLVNWKGLMAEHSMTICLRYGYPNVIVPNASSIGFGCFRIHLITIAIPSASRCRKRKITLIGQECRM